MSFSLRDKQARIALDYDRDIAERAFNLSKKWIKQFNETYLEPKRQEKAVAFEIDNYFVKLQNACDVVLDSYYSSRDEQPTAEIVKIYNSLVAYLNQYIARNPLNQRDWSIIEDKFDLISVPVGKISAIADANGWRGRETMATLIDLLEYHNYVSLDNNSLKRMPLDAQKFAVPSVRFDRPAVLSVGAEMEVRTPEIDKKAIKRFIDTLSATKINRIVNEMPEEQGNELQAELGLIVTLKERRKFLQLEAKNNLAFAEIMMDQMQRASPSKAAVDEELGFYPSPQTEAGFERERREDAERARRVAFNRAEEYGAAIGRYEAMASRPPPPLPSEFNPLIKQEKGEGRQKSGKGTPEGILGGLPGGMRNALALRPIDRRPLNLDNEMPDDEFDLSLPMRMQFLTNTDHYKLYDDDEPVINSQSQYKKMKKRLAKLKD